MWRSEGQVGPLVRRLVWSAVEIVRHVPRTQEQNWLRVVAPPDSLGVDDCLGGSPGAQQQSAVKSGRLPRSVFNQWFSLAAGQVVALLGARVGLLSRKPYPRSTGALSYPFAHRHTHRWIGG